MKADFGFGFELPAGEEKTLLERVDPRVKVFFSISFLILCSAAKKIYVPAAVVFLAAAGLISLKPGRRTLRRRFLPVLLIAGMIIMTQLLFFGQTELAVLDVTWFRLKLYKEGLHRGLLMIFRVLAGAGMMILLSISTPVEKFIFAARSFRMPNAALEVMTIAYRYIFVLMDEAVTVYNAQKVRLGFSGRKKALNAWAGISGMTLIRAVDKSEKLYKAMKSRGYTGQAIKTHYRRQMKREDWLFALALSFALAAGIIFAV